MALDPSIISGIGKQPSLDLGQLLQQRNAIKLGSLAAVRQQQTQDALDRVRADPTDMHSIADLAALDPQAANGYLAAQAAGRAGMARAATANLFRSGAPDTQPAPATPAPDPAAATPPGTTVALPATGQSITLPGAATPPAPAAPSGGGPSAPPGGATDPFDHKGPAEQIVGANVTNGKMTMQEAAAQLAEVADPAQVQQVLGTLKSMDDLQFERVARTNKTMADTLASIKASVPVDPNNPSQPARHAALMQNAPQLAALGITPQQLAQIDLSDQGINGVVGKAMGYQGIIEQANKDRDAAREQAVVDETHRSNLANEHKPVAQSFGTNLIDPVTGKVVADGMGGSTSGAAPTSIPDIAARITAVEGTGDNPNSSAVGPGQMLDKTFVSTFRQAFPQQASLSDAQILSKRGTGVEGQMVQTLVANNAAQLSQAGIQPTAGNIYIAHFLGPSGAIGVLKAAPSTPMSNIVSAAAVKANPMLAKMTAGDLQTWANTKMGGAADSGPPTITAAAGLTAKALTDAADMMVKNGGKAPEGFSRNAAQQAALRNAYSIRKQQLGLTTDQVIQGGQDVASQGKAFTNWNSGRPGTGAVVARSMSVAVEHLDQAQQLATALQNGNTPLFNRIAQGWAEQTGKPAPTNFAAVKDFVTDEVVKGVLGGPGAAGDREKANAILANWNSPAQTTGIVKQLQGLMASQLRGQSMQYHATTGRDDFTKYVSPRANQVLAAHGEASTVPAAAAAYLKQNPATRAQFDQKYGAAASAAILGG